MCYEGVIKYQNYGCAQEKLTKDTVTGEWASLLMWLSVFISASGLDFSSSSSCLY